MQRAEDGSPVVRFSLFEVDLQTGEIRKGGRKVYLQEQPFQVLATLLERPGELVTREELREKLWPAETVDFDSGLNKAVQKLREALDDSPDKPRFVQTLPRRGYRFIAPVERAGVSSVLAPSELRPAEDLAVEGDSRQSLYKPLTLTVAFLVLALLVGVLLGFNVGAWRDWLHRSERARIESLVVLPLENLSADPAEKYFADGMTDGLITEIARISSLRVISRTSSMRYKDARKPLQAIAQELGVDAVLEGTVLRSGRKLRITAQLIRVQDDRHLWAEKYERDLNDVLTLQGEVAQAIAAQIQVKLTAQQHASLARVHPVDPKAYIAYAEGNFFRNQWTEKALSRSIELFSEAIRLDPAYAQGYAGLSHAHYALGIRGLRPAGEVYPKAKAAAIKALELDETNAEAHNTLAEVKKGYDWDWAGAKAEYERAIELSPSYSIAIDGYAEWLSKMGRHTEAIAEARRAREIDPVSVNANTVLAMLLYRARRYDQAIAASRKALEYNPNHLSAIWWLALSHEQKGEFPEAIAELEKAAKLSGGEALYRALLANVYALAGKRGEALRILDEVKALSRQKYVSPVDMAIVYTGLGDRESAFQWLEKAYQDRVMRVQELPQPHFDSLRSDARFQVLMRRIGLPL
jgi:TolB-like protein/DNA-binding winged helix-turn-helix (wHTH) protein/Tfp pilus assembly protein PilF